ncbi:iron ABC transporter substrate-binding protein [Corynebacterium comes]|uniref:Fe(3+)-binding periplasmic protein n=1 Tax=Corynebacterium comes TaxID=2675218 RepID=A0A6B8VHR9_9CORY|nr:iron ABC transporter substrate-binding protein [Corynebacterium comes]QGU04842.1 Fe(3+)-binding periplasmic protein precursor [Corynebacterium comes]
MRSFTRMTLAAIASAGVITGLTACADTGSEDSADTTGTTSAASDDTLVIYSGRDENLIAPLIERFEEATGIRTEVRYGSTAEQAQLLITEGSNSPAEVFLSQEAGALGLVAQEGMLVELPEEVLEKVPAAFSSDDGQWVGLTGRARVVAYDEETVTEEEAPDTLAEMVDPKWAGEIAIAPGNASFLSFVTAIRVTEGEEAARDFLQKLKDNDVQTYEKNGDILEAVNTGEVEIGLINHYYWYQSAAEVGADNMRAQLKYGQPGDLAALINATGAGVLKQDTQDPQAIEFIEYLLSEEGQAYFAEETFEYPLLKGAEGPEGVPAFDAGANPDFDLSDMSSVDDTAALIDEVGLNIT